MIVDSSAVLAIMLSEQDSEAYLDALLSVGPRRMSVANWLETAMVIDRRGTTAAASGFEEFMRDADIEVMPVTASQGTLARAAWQRYGRGNHPAKLNYGDCFAYALAKETREPLLFKGNDFARTDVEPALKS
jgi:ribonuclease VapC